MLHALRDARTKQGLTQKQLAERMGITRSYYTKIETGVVRGVPVNLALRIAEELGGCVETLFGPLLETHVKDTTNASKQ